LISSAVIYYSYRKHTLTEIFSGAKQILLDKVTIHFFLAARYFSLVQHSLSCSKKIVLVARKTILQQEKKCFVTVSRNFTMASEVISMRV